MPDITIPIDTPVTRPAVTAKTFNEIFILDLNVRAHSLDEQDTIYVEFCPFDKASGERLLTDKREIRVPLWAALQSVPEAEAAFAAIAAAVPALVTYQKALREAEILSFPIL